MNNENMKKTPKEPELKAFNKGWGRSLACAIHYLKLHLGAEFDKEALVDYMESNRERQFRDSNNSRKVEK